MKFKLLVLGLVVFSLNLSPGRVEAGVLDRFLCFIGLRSAATPAKPQQKKLPPLARPIDSTTTSTDLFTDPCYFWFPGNIWYLIYFSSWQPEPWMSDQASQPAYQEAQRMQAEEPERVRELQREAQAEAASSSEAANQDQGSEVRPEPESQALGEPSGGAGVIDDDTNRHSAPSQTYTAPASEPSSSEPSSGSYESGGSDNSSSFDSGSGGGSFD